MNDLWQELEDKRRLLNDCISSLKDNGIALARHEHDYKMALRTEIFRLHEAEKVAWTACINLAHGDENVAGLRQSRDLAKTKYDVLIEKINGLKLEMRILEGQLSREWGISK